MDDPLILRKYFPVNTMLRTTHYHTRDIFTVNIDICKRYL